MSSYVAKIDICLFTSCCAEKHCNGTNCLALHIHGEICSASMQYIQRAFKMSTYAFMFFGSRDLPELRCRLVTLLERAPSKAT